MKLIDFAVADFWTGDPKTLIRHVEQHGVSDTPAMREVVLHLLRGEKVPTPADAQDIDRRIELLESALAGARLLGLRGRSPALSTRRSELAAVYRTVAEWCGEDEDSIKRWAARNPRARHLIDVHKRLVKGRSAGPCKAWRTIR